MRCRTGTRKQPQTPTEWLASGRIQGPGRQKRTNATGDVPNPTPALRREMGGGQELPKRHEPELNKGGQATK